MRQNIRSLSDDWSAAGSPSDPITRFYERHPYPPPVPRLTALAADLVDTADSQATVDYFRQLWLHDLVVFDASSARLD